MTFLKPSYPLDIANTIAEVLNGGFEQLWENREDEALVMLQRTARYLQVAGWPELTILCEDAVNKPGDTGDLDDRFYDHIHGRADWGAFYEDLVQAADAAEGAG